MQFKNLFTSSSGIIYNINDAKAISGTWKTKVNMTALDNYLLIHIGNRELLGFFEGFTEQGVLSYMSDILSGYAYKLDGLMDSTLFEYDAIMNKDRTFEHQETRTSAYGDIDTSNTYGQRQQTNVYASRSDSSSIGAHTDSTTETRGAHTDSTSESLGSRSDSSSESFGARTDSHTSSGQATAFDTGDYAKGTDKVTNSDTVGAQSNSGSNTIGAQSNSSSISVGKQENSTSTSIGAQSNSYTKGGGTDTVTNSSTSDSVKVEHEDDETTVSIHEREYGNIGEMSTQELIERQRNIVNFVFFDAVQEILLHEFAKSFCWDI